MSVLSFPRIYFKGYMEWDPCTFNNNDWQAFPTYDAANAALNWPFLATQGAQVPPGITPDNFTTTFRPWAISLLDDSNPGDNPPNGPPGKRIPAEWNMFGGHGVSFVQYNEFTTTIIGGDIGYNQPVTSDPIIGGQVALNGDGGNGAGRLVDTNPASPWSSQVYFGQLGFGSGNSGLSAPRVFRMHSRWLNPNRIYSTDSSLTSPASSIGVCFQTCVPFAQVAWPATSASQLITALQQAAEQPGALGIMVRFTAYVNLYFMNGIFNNATAQPRTYEDLASALATAWDAWNTGKDPSKFFSNPCYSHIVGTVGVWNEGELASVPGGRCLAAEVPVAPVGLTDTKSPASPRPTRIVGHELKSNAIAGTGNPVPLGPVAVNVDYNASLISLDFGGTLPELGVPGAWPSDLSKANFGTLSVGVIQNDSFAEIQTVDYDQYQQSAYEARAGIIDIPFPDSGTAHLLQSGKLAIQVQGQTALLEQVFTAETDRRGIYLDENGQVEFQITVCRMGVPSPGSNVLLAQYDSGLSLIPNPSTLAPFVEFLNGTVVPIGSGGTATILTTDENGNATAIIGAKNPGFPVIAFFPYSAQDNSPPQPPPAFSFVDNAFYTTVRVLPFDDALPGQFVELWNATNDPAQAWEFIYFNVLSVYDMLFSVMLRYVNLGDRSQVEGRINGPHGIWNLTSETAAAESTYAMPITRDMSAGKRMTLQLWMYLVSNNYFVQEPGLPIPSDTAQGSNKLAVDSIPRGWRPNA